MALDFQIRKIIVLANLPGKRSLQAALWADYFAAAFQSKVVLYDTVAPMESNQDIPIQDMVNHYGVLLQSSFSRLKKLAQHITRADQVNHIAELGVPTINLIHQAKHEDADLIVLNVPELAEELSPSFYALLYSSPCPVFFARSSKVPVPPKKILVPVRLKHGLEQKMPAVIAMAKAFKSTICLSAFEHYNTKLEDKQALETKLAQFRVRLQSEGIAVETETVRGRHFGASMLRSIETFQADMLAVVVEPSNFIQRVFKKMMGKYFLERSPVPVLAVPIVRRATRGPKEIYNNEQQNSSQKLFVDTKSLTTNDGRAPNNLLELSPLQHS